VHLSDKKPSMLKVAPPMCVLTCVIACDIAVRMLKTDAQTQHTMQ